MNFYEILFLSLGLAMDAVAVSITSGFVVKRPKLPQAFKMAAFFGAFQSLMPCIGWAVGLRFQKLISGIDHWVAFGLLLLIGAKMIYEAIAKKDGEEESHPFDLGVLLILSVATSIDALAAGVSFALLKISITVTVTMIGLTTFALSFLGVLAGKKFGHFLEDKVRIAGGLILIGIGLKILIEHLLA